MAIEANIRVQVNLVMGETKFNDDIKRFDNSVLPIFFVEIIVERIPLGAEIMLGLLFRILPAIQICLVVVFGIVGAFCLFFAFFNFLKIKVRSRSLSDDKKIQKDSDPDESRRLYS